MVDMRLGFYPLRPPLPPIDQRPSLRSAREAPLFRVTYTLLGQRREASLRAFSEADARYIFEGRWDPRAAFLQAIEISDGAPVTRTSRRASSPSSSVLAAPPSVSAQQPTWIDTTFDFRTDASGPDPDNSSPTLKRYHQLLWSKPLPSGRPFHLEAVPRGYLRHQSELGEFFLSSDAVIPDFTRWKRLRHITEQFPEEENEAFRSITYTIGGMMVFPGNKVDGKNTINGERGLNSKIADRMDLTLECIRLNYIGKANPLGNVLSRYPEFFSLFENFRGYVDFFLLQDLVTEDCSEVQFFMPFDDFNTAPTPKNVDAYKDYRRRSIEFIEARNCRIGRYAAHLR
jgi:hypothetical protein